MRAGKNFKPRILVLEIRDKDQPENPALGWLLVERVETYQTDSRDGMIYKASIELSYQRIVPKFSRANKGWFSGCYDRSVNGVSLTSSSMPRGEVFLDLPGLEGQRIGTYLMNEIVQWAQQWPNAVVSGIELNAGQAYAENKARRNWFYEQFGLVFDYTDSEKRSGLSRLMPVHELCQVETWKKNITEHWMLDYLAMLISDTEKTSWKLQARERACQNLIEYQKHVEARPIRWALRQWCYRHINGTLMWGFLIVIACAAWISRR